MPRACSAQWKSGTTWDVGLHLHHVGTKIFFCFSCSRSRSVNLTPIIVKEETSYTAQHQPLKQGEKTEPNTKQKTTKISPNHVGILDPTEACRFGTEMGASCSSFFPALGVTGNSDLDKKDHRSTLLTQPPAHVGPSGSGSFNIWSTGLMIGVMLQRLQGVYHTSWLTTLLSNLHSICKESPRQWSHLWQSLVPKMVPKFELCSPFNLISLSNGTWDKKAIN